MRIFGRSLLPKIPGQGTTLIPLLNADEIFQAEQEVIESTRSGKSLYMSHYSLPVIHEGSSVGTPASNAQREIIPLIEAKIRKNQVKAFIIADNSLTNSRETIGKIKRNEGTIEYLHEIGANVLPYPPSYVSINHTKFIANDDYLVITSANLSNHSADSPDDNTGFLVSGAATHNGILHAFLSQWNFAVKEDAKGWAEKYLSPNINAGYLFDEKVYWLNTAPKEETGKSVDSTEIFDGYRRLIQRAASGPPKAYLYFEHFDLSNLALMRHLLYAHHVNPTLDIRFILDPNQYLEGLKAGAYDTRVVAFNEVKNAGIPLRFARVKAHPNGSQDPQRFHDKFVVYNDEQVINGSGNLSNHSLNVEVARGPSLLANRNFGEGGNGDFPVVQARHNREVDVLVRDAECAKAMKGKFLEDWVYRSFEDPRVASGEGFDNPR